MIATAPVCVSLVLLAFVTTSFCQDYFFCTDPALDLESDPLELFVVATADEPVEVTCSVTDVTDFEEVETQWELIENSEFLTFNSSGVALNHSYISVSGDFNKVLTISNFTQNLDKLTIGCRGSESSEESVLITFGFLVGPTLLQAQVHDAIEFQTFSLDLLVSKSNVFPPDSVFPSEWYCNDGPIESCDVTTGVYNITINSVTRDYNGSEFELVIFEPRQSVKFSLNVLYQPEAQLSSNITTVFASVGDTVELIAATNVNGKPTPSTLWRINNHPIEVSGRYSAEVAGQLLIQNIVVADFGVYNFIASNGIGENLTTEIILSEIEPRFELVSVISKNGGLHVSWMLAHTGYETEIDQLSLTIVCNEEESNDVADSELGYSCSSDCIDDSLMGTNVIEGKLYAGNFYHCQLTAATVNGSSTYNTGSFRSTTGIPSLTQLSVSVESANSITISVQSQYPGDEETLVFMITITEKEVGTLVYNTSTVGESSKNITVDHDQPFSNGMHLAYATSWNKYGMSEGVSYVFEISNCPPPDDTAGCTGPKSSIVITLAVIMTVVMTRIMQF